jgi:hypothetical protein
LSSEVCRAGSNPNAPNLSPLATDILRSVQEISWSNQLWFPVVQRHMLDLHCDADDSDIHAVVVSLIENRVLVPISPHLPFLWEMANLDETPGTDPSLRKISTSAESEARLAKAVSTHVWIDKLFSREPDRKIAIGAPADVTYLESHILLAIDHLGWFAYLWFPVVHREYLNFGSRAPDSDIHQAFTSLIRKGALVPNHDEPGDMPDWLPAPEAFKTAVYKGLGRRI